MALDFPSLATTMASSPRKPDLAPLKARYYHIPLAQQATSPGQLLDAVIRHELFRSPKKNYAQVMREVLDADPALKLAYAES